MRSKYDGVIPGQYEDLESAFSSSVIRIVRKVILGGPRIAGGIGAGFLLDQCLRDCRERGAPNNCPVSP